MKFIPILLLALAAYVSVIHAFSVVKVKKMERSGEVYRFTFVFFISAILCLFAFFIDELLGVWNYGWWFFLPAAMDIANLSLVAWPFVWMYEKLTKKS